MIDTTTKAGAIAVAKHSLSMGDVEARSKLSDNWRKHIEHPVHWNLDKNVYRIKPEDETGDAAEWKNPFNAFNLIGLIRAAPPIVPDQTWITPDTAPDRINVYYQFTVPRFSQKIWEYHFVIRRDWTEEYLKKNLAAVKQAISDGLGEFVKEEKEKK